MWVKVLSYDVKAQNCPKDSKSLCDPHVKGVGMAQAYFTPKSYHLKTDRQIRGIYRDFNGKKSIV